MTSFQPILWEYSG